MSFQQLYLVNAVSVEYFFLRCSWFEIRNIYSYKNQIILLTRFNIPLKLLNSLKYKTCFFGMSLPNWLLKLLHLILSSNLKLPRKFKGKIYTFSAKYIKKCVFRNFWIYHLVHSKKNTDLKRYDKVRISKIHWNTLSVMSWSRLETINSKSLIKHLLSVVD